MAVFVQQSKKGQSIAVATKNHQSLAQYKSRTPAAGLIPEMQALFHEIHDGADERMAQIARMPAMEDQLEELRRKADAPPAAAPIFRGVRCTEEGAMPPSTWQAVVQVHGPGGSRMADCKIQLDLFYYKVQPTMVELRISVLRWVPLNLNSQCCRHANLFSITMFIG